MPYLPCFGMRVILPKQFENVEYYGKGPYENYVDRNNSCRIGLYDQTVKEQFYPYIRPQETGNKTEVRWWKLTNKAGQGAVFKSDVPFSASALNYLTEDLDDGINKEAHQSHSGELEERDFVQFRILAKQMGLGCIDSWGAWPLKNYMIPYGDYSFTFLILPTQK